MNVTGSPALQSPLPVTWYDLWRVNVDADYYEEGDSLSEEELKALDASQPLVPSQIRSGTVA